MKGIYGLISRSTSLGNSKQNRGDSQSSRSTHNLRTDLKLRTSVFHFKTKSKQNTKGAHGWTDSSSVGSQKKKGREARFSPKTTLVLWHQTQDVYRYLSDIPRIRPWQVFQYRPKVSTFNKLQGHVSAQDSSVPNAGTPPFPDMLDPPATTLKKKKVEIASTNDIITLGASRDLSSGPC